MAFHRRMLFYDEDCLDHFPCDDDVSPPLPQPPPPPPPPPPVGAPYDGHHHLLILIFVGSAVVACLLLLSIAYFAVLRRRRHRVAFFPSAASGGTPPSDDGDVAPAAFDEAEAPLHHVWYIRTVGLDEATIEKIAVTQYKAAEGLRAGDGDCSVCLGEFEDGDLVRLLPKCGHAFHVPCIDTWLRARVNCPLCRAPVVDPDGAAAASAVAAPPSSDAAGVPVDSGSSTFSDPDVARLAQAQAAEEEQSRAEGQELVINVGAAADTDEEASEGTSDSSPDSRAFYRRSASMDSTFLDAVVVRLQPEAIVGCSEEAKVHSSCGRQGSSRAKESVLRSLSTGGRAFFLYRHSRAAKNAAPPSLPL